MRLYSNLFTDPDPDAAGKDFIECMNPDSLEVLSGCKVEKMLADEASGAHFQFLRQAISSATARTPRPGAWCSTAPWR